MKHLSLLSAACVLGTIALASNAKAVTVPQYVSILLDGSGSMLTESYYQEDPNQPAAKRTKWQEGIRLARQRVEGQRDDKDPRMPTDPNWYVNEDDDVTSAIKYAYYPATTHCYQVSVFHEASVDQMYPPASSGQQFICAGTVNGVKQKQIYNDVVTLLNSLSPPANTDVTTPLADGLCKALNDSAQWALPGDYTRSIILETDGLENSSSQSDCVGDNTGTFNGTLVNAAHPEFLAWAGGAPSTSWMYKVYSKAIGYTNDVNFYNAAPWVVNKSDGVTFDHFVWGIRAPGAGVTAEMQNLAYFFSESFGFLPGNAQAGAFSARIALMNVDALYSYVPLGTPAATANALAVATYPDQLRNFFKGMAQHTRARYQKIQYKGSDFAAPRHNPLGDVDNSGCTTTADLTQVRQVDVFGRAANSTPHTWLADANQDGWVDNSDALVVLTHNNQCRPGCTLATQTQCVH
jgi:hypothetical protein